MYSRKTLATEFNISNNTVINTLKALGLDHKRDDFSEEEKTLFKQARELFDQGFNFKEVTQHFGQGNQEEETKAPLDNETIINQTLLNSVLYDLDVRSDVAIEVAFQLFPKMLENKMQERGEELLEALKKASHRKADNARNITAYSTNIEPEDPKGLGSGDA